MQSEAAKTRLFLLALINLSFMILGSNAAAQQSVEDNVRPAGQVCLAGQACVGSTQVALQLNLPELQRQWRRL